MKHALEDGNLIDDDMKGSNLKLWDTSWLDSGKKFMSLVSGGAG